ncbi:Sec23-binding domain of Sec16-domain-containing protein [Jimgerdemannia flammicorona]|uniref:Protein transport protein sec16 n=1 Tax=Jimgerdemannia flammicorona TaxID=994334 RepID=A0A433QGJ2_9FUNG|nr:Sec23-binding domain of Sec16-domain-containing protein [Jimgerdemannia flammicorona]
MADEDGPIPFFTTSTKPTQDASALFGRGSGAATNGHDFFGAAGSAPQPSQQTTMVAPTSTNPAAFFEQPHHSGKAQDPASFFDTLGSSDTQAPSALNTKTQQGPAYSQPQGDAAAAVPAAADPYSYYGQQYDPSAQQYDPNAQQYDPNAQQYDPNAQQYDPNTYYDPNNANQQYDYSQYGYSAEQLQQYAGYDYSQYDPNYAAYYAQQQQQYDPNAYDPQQQPQYDSSQNYDPNQVYDQQQYGLDPNAASYYEYSQSASTVEYAEPNHQQEPPIARQDSVDVAMAPWDRSPTVSPGSTTIEKRSDSLTSNLALDLVPSLEQTVASVAFQYTESEQADGVVPVSTAEQSDEGIPVLAVAQVEAAIEGMEESTGRERELLAEAQRVASPRQIPGEEISIVQNFANDQDYYQYETSTSVLTPASGIAVVPTISSLMAPDSAPTPEQIVPATPDGFEEEAAMVVPADEKVRQEVDEQLGLVEGVQEVAVVKGEKGASQEVVEDLDDLVLGGGDAQVNLDESKIQGEESKTSKTPNGGDGGVGYGYEFNEYKEYDTFRQQVEGAQQQQQEAEGGYSSWYEPQREANASQPLVAKEDDGEGGNAPMTEEWYSNQDGYTSTSYEQQTTGDAEKATQVTWYEEYGGYGSEYGAPHPRPEQSVLAAESNANEMAAALTVDEQQVYPAQEGIVLSNDYGAHGEYTGYGTQQTYQADGVTADYGHYQQPTNGTETITSEQQDAYSGYGTYTEQGYYGDQSAYKPVSGDAAEVGGGDATALAAQQEEYTDYSQYEQQYGVSADDQYAQYAYGNGEATANQVGQGYGQSTHDSQESQQAYGYYSETTQYSYTEETVAAPPPPTAMTSPFGIHASNMPPLKRQDSTGSPVSTSFQQLASCPHPGCGAELKPTDKFCPECGGKVLSAPSRSGTPSISVSGVVAVAATTAVAAAASQSPYNAMYGQSPGTYLPPGGRGVSKYPSRSVSPLAQASYPPPTQSTSGYLPPGTEYSPDTVLRAPHDQYSSFINNEPETAAVATWTTATDPLGRSHGCPLATFGFGGKLFVMFPHRVQRFQSSPYGAMAAEPQQPVVKTVPGSILIKSMKDLLANDAEHATLTSFPGPLLADSGKGGVKQKKKDVLKYLDERVAEDEARAQNAVPGTENGALLWKLVRIVCDSDGMITGSPKTDESIRTLLVPPKDSQTENDLNTFTVPADSQPDTQFSVDDAVDSDATRILDALQDLLLKGDRPAAVKYAIQEDLWAHALIIGSCVNKEVWREVVNGFAQRELAGDAIPGQASKKAVQADRVALRVLYALFAGHGQAAVQEFLHQKSSPVGQFNHASQQAHRDNPVDKLSKWKETLALILANRTPKDHDALTALGDLLREYGRIEAAHICYLLSPQSSFHSGIDTAHVRLVLIGHDHLRGIGSFYRDLDAIYRTELWEFALSGKAAAANSGLPFLQCYKLIHAWRLADHGLIQEAQRYCEAIACIVKSYPKSSPYFHKCFLVKLKELNDLLEANGGRPNTGADSAASWLSNKLPKPTLDSIWGSLEGKFSKFVSGEDTANAGNESRPSTEIVASPYTGNPPTRSLSASDFRGNRSSTGSDAARRAATPSAAMMGDMGSRSSSPGFGFGAFGFGQTFTSIPDANAGASAVGVMSTVQEREGEVVSSYNSSTSWGGYSANSYDINGHGQSNAEQLAGNGYGSYGYGGGGYEPGGGTASAVPAAAATAGRRGMFSPFGNPPASNPPASNQNNATGYTGTNWWENSATSETQQEQMMGGSTNRQNYDASTFVSPMGNTTTPAPPPQQASQARGGTWEGGDDDDDLGFGNNALKKKDPVVKPQDQEDKGKEAAAPAESTSSGDASKESSAATNEGASKGGWGIFNLWSRSSTSTPTETKAKKANLGEESSFYYDEKEKRWVNKKAGSDTPPVSSAPPAPPKTSSRPITPISAPPMTPTTSTPSRTGAPGGGLAPPPMGPMRTASAPVSGPPPLGIGSPLNPADITASRSSSAGGNRRARSRYVDVLNQPSQS